jgi:hypothetical protein
MGILTDIPYVHNHNQTDIFISQGSTHDIKQIRSYQFRSQFKIYTGSYQEFRFNNWSCFIITRIIINIYIIKKHDPIHINKLNIYNISHAYGKLSTHLTRKQTEVKSRHWRKSYWRPAGRISRLSEYKWDIFKNDSKEHLTYLIHLSKGLFHNPICFWTD